MDITPIMNGVEKFLHPLVKMFDRITWGVLFFLMVMTMADVLVRKLLNSSILGAVEITELLMTVTIFCSLAQCQVNNGHIQVDLIYKKLTPRLQKICDVLTQFGCSVLFFFVSLGTFHHAVNMKEWGEMTMDLELPIFPFVFIAALGCLLLSLVLFFRFVEALNEVFDS